MTSALSDAVWEVAGRNESVLILAHPCGGTRFACEHLRDTICPAGSHDAIRNRRVTHEGASIGPDPGNADAPVTVATISFRHLPGSPAYEKYDHIWHMVRNPIEHAFSASFKFNPDGLWSGLKLPEQGYTFKRHPDCGCRQDMTARKFPLRCAMMTVSEFNRQAEEVATRRFRVEDIPGERDSNHVHIRGPRTMPTWDEFRRLDEKWASLLYQQWVKYGYGAKYFDNPPR